MTNVIQFPKTFPPIRLATSQEIAAAPITSRPRYAPMPAYVTTSKILNRVIMDLQDAGWKVVAYPDGSISCAHPQIDSYGRPITLGEAQQLTELLGLQ